MSRLARGAIVLLALGGASLALGCLSRSFPDQRRFHLEIERPGRSEAACDCSARVERVRVARLFEGRSFVYQTADGTAREDFYNQFFTPPGALIREQARGWLVDSGLFGRVVPATVAVRADWLIEGRVSSLYADMRGDTPRAILQIQWAMLDGSSRDLEVAFDRSYGGSKELPDRSARTIAEAWSELLAQIMTTFEADLRAFFAARAEPAAAANAEP